MIENFKFLLIRDPDTNLIFVSVDSLAGYMRMLAEGIDKLPPHSATTGDILQSLAYVLENIEDFSV